MKYIHYIIILCSFYPGLSSIYAQPVKAERSIFKQVTLEAPVAKVWEAWTTNEGAKTFFAPDCKIELKVGGAYEMYFDAEAEPGSRGGEGITLLAIEPQKMLSFTWTAPPHIASIRDQFTHVTVRFTKLDDHSTLITLIHDGWGEGADWDKAFTYFDAAWGQIVLPRVVYRFKIGPIDWKNPPPM